jgi:hypothetical protein
VPLSLKFGKQRRVGNFRNERTRSTPFEPELMFSGRFGPFRYYTKVDAKLAELAPLTQKFTKQSHVGMFRNERTRSTPLDPKQKFWSVLDRFVTPRKSMQNWPNWCQYRTNSLNEVASKCFATKDPIHSNGPKIHVSGRFEPFRNCTKVDAK